MMPIRNRSTGGSMELELLKGFKVLINAHYIPGPVAAWFLRQMGARVIKLEPPGTGDYMRSAPPYIQDIKGSGRISSFFYSLNYGFESIAVNLKSEEGVGIFRKLLGYCDVYIDGNRPGFSEKVLGEKVVDVNPEIIYAPITAWGQDGPYVRKAGHDGNCLSIAGTLSYNSTSRRQTPSMIGSQVSDINSGLLAAIGVLGMLVGRLNQQCSSVPRVYDCAMLDAAVHLNQIYVSRLNADHQPMKPDKEWLNGGEGYYNVYLTKDNKPALFGAIEPGLFKNFTDAIQRPDLIGLRKSSVDDPMKLIQELEKIFAERTLQEWNELLKDCDCCFTQVNDVREAMEDPQIRFRESIMNVVDPVYGSLKQTAYPGRFDGCSVSVMDSAPGLGNCTEKILGELEYGKDKIDQFYADKIVM